VGAGLRLEVRDYDGPARWRWVLTDASGTFIADHEVQVDEHSWQYEAFTDLQYYISSYAAPDRYAEDEAQIVADVSEWMGSEVFGPVSEALVRAAKRALVTVRVVVPDGAEALLFRPLELAHADGSPLAVQNITLVMETAGDDSADDADPARNRLRVLGLFSLPEGGQALNLRRERHALVRLINRIAARGKVADVSVLQYGATRNRLRDILEEAESWDIIHISGHGAPGELLLETAGGTPDKVSAAELADMLAPARERVKLVTVSACWSAAMTAAEQRRLLGLPTLKDHLSERIGGNCWSPGSVATELAERLSCAVLAMRYPVDDDFAIELSEKLYELLADKGQPLARAVGMTVKELTAGNKFPALSAATPALFGRSAAELRLAAPSRTGPPSYGTRELKMAGFPPQPERFVGRTGVMTRSSAALADESGIPGVLLHGMPGGGKTACALELAYTHEHTFDRLVWYKAPDEGTEISSALTDFALTLERYLEDFQMVHVVSDTEKLLGFLPRLTELMERSRLLLVIDNGESLLTDHGQWRDDRWGQVIGALTAHHGLGRVIVTSRRVPAETLRSIASNASGETPGPFMESVDALSVDEALLLTRELPHLCGLINGDLPGIDRDTAQRLALGVLNVAQGHPKLLELANGQAAHPERLADFVAAGDQAWLEQGGLPDGFFTTGETAAGPGDYLHILAAWTNAVTDALVPAERDLFWFLCCLEEPDRERAILAANWGGLWKGLGRDGQPPALNGALEVIVDRGLVVKLARADDKAELYAIHPGVSDTGRVRAGQPFQDTVDAAAAFFWRSGLQYASRETSQYDVNTRLIARAGFAAVPYLIRQEQWESAAATLEFAFNRDPSRANAAAMLPFVQKIAGNLESATLLSATVTEVIDPAAAEVQVRSYLDATIARGDYRAAMIAVGRLAYQRFHSGRLTEALAFADEAVSYAQQAEVGPWTKLGTEVQRLQMLSETEDTGSVLLEIQRLRNLMEALVSSSHDDDEAARSWDVREALLNIDRSVRIELGEWDEALAVNAGIIASMHHRRAPASQITVARMNDYGPLLRRGEVSQARDLLLDCRQAFQDANDLRMLGTTLGGLADAEEMLGHVDNAIKLACDALRYGYAADDTATVQDVYHNLGNYLAKHANRPISALACHLCAALIKALSGTRDTERSVRAASVVFYVFGNAVESPTSIADLSSKIGDIPGTDPAALITRLSPAPEMAERTLQDLIARARQLACMPSGDATPEQAGSGTRCQQD
jgi:tetratricopeptide (TPR) repeat protein